jgi:hypothetical protein
MCTFGTAIICPLNFVPSQLHANQGVDMYGGEEEEEVTSAEAYRMFQEYYRKI